MGVLLVVLMFCTLGLGILVKAVGNEPDWGQLTFHLLFLGILYIGHCIAHS